MNILVLGSGGREYTFAWKILQSPRADKVFVAPGNAGTSQIATNLDIGVNDFDQIKSAVVNHEIQLVVVGPEDPLVNGIVDFFKLDDQLANVMIIGPNKAGAQLEGSKDFSKAFMNEFNVPTATAKTFRKETIAQGLEYLKTCAYPIVLKADGLAAGKGVIIATTLHEAEEHLKAMLLDAQFGAASSSVLIEDYLQGIELSVFVLTDGSSYTVLPEAKDYKRIGEGDTGLNTGGMGAVSPVPFANEDFMRKVKAHVIEPTISGLKTRDIDYKGFIFIGLMNVEGNPYVIEYNVRMGDPETQVVLPRTKTDFLSLLEACANQKLDSITLETESNIATTVVAVSGGYPEAYEKGKVISGIAESDNSIIIHAGTTLKDNQVVTSGGRVLAVTSMGKTLEEALEGSYTTLEKVSFDGMYYRKDIGKDILALSN